MQVRIRQIILHAYEIETPFEEVEKALTLKILEVASLLIDCLSLAVVTDRNRIEEGVLVPSHSATKANVASQAT
jgi:hypothetical protein